ncbi:flagellar motor switch protein [Roseivivax sp. CAU 1753]
MVGEFIDIVIVALLVVAIGFGMVLDRRVRRLTNALRELKPTVEDFSIAVDRSEDSVSALRSDFEPDAIPAAAPKAEQEMDRPSSLLSFRSRRVETPVPPAKPSGVKNVDGKADLVRDFFETARSRQA